MVYGVGMGIGRPRMALARRSTCVYPLAPATTTLLLPVTRLRARAYYQLRFLAAHFTSLSEMDNDIHKLLGTIIIANVYLFREHIKFEKCNASHV